MTGEQVLSQPRGLWSGLRSSSRVVTEGLAPVLRGLTHFTRTEEWRRLPEADMTPVLVGNGVSDDVLEINSASGTCEAEFSAAGNDRVLAASANLCAGGGIRIELRLEPVGGPEGTRAAAVEASHEEFLARLQVHAAGYLPAGQNVRVPTTSQAPRHDNRRKVVVSRGRRGARACSIDERSPGQLVRGRMCRHGKRDQQAGHQHDHERQSSSVLKHCLPPSAY